MKSIDLGEDSLALERQVYFALSVASRNVMRIARTTAPESSLLITPGKWEHPVEAI